MSKKKIFLECHTLSIFIHVRPHNIHEDTHQRYADGKKNSHVASASWRRMLFVSVRLSRGIAHISYTIYTSNALVNILFLFVIKMDITYFKNKINFFHFFGKCQSVIILHARAEKACEHQERAMIKRFGAKYVYIAVLRGDIKRGYTMKMNTREMRILGKKKQRAKEKQTKY